MMCRSVRLGILAAALTTASPALASDFSGLGRIFLWGILALGALILIPLALASRNRRAATPEGDATIATLGAIIFAPTIAYRDYSEWVFVPFPGTAVAMLDARWDVLWPVPLLSMILCAGGAYWLLQRWPNTGTHGDDDGDGSTQ